MNRVKDQALAVSAATVAIVAALAFSVQAIGW